MSSRPPTRIPPPPSDPPDTHSASALMDAVIADEEVDPDTGVHFVPPGPRASPIERAHYELGVERFRRERGDKAAFASLRKLEGRHTALAAQVNSWAVHLFGLEGQSVGVLGRLEQSIERLGADIAKLGARMEQNKLESDKRLEHNERAWFRVSAAAAIGVGIGTIVLRFFL